MAAVRPSYIFRIVIGLLATAVLIGVVSYVVVNVWFGPSSAGGIVYPLRIPVPPTPPIPETTNIFFLNERSEPCYVVPVYGSATDINHWTVWPKVPNQASPDVKVAPHTADLTWKFVAPGEPISFPVFTAGMASLSFIIRVNCNEEKMICERGDSVFVEGLDGPKNDPTDGLKRGSVPFKPAIDTRVEMTYGCMYQDRTLCAINPSCITKQADACSSLPALMQQYPLAKFHDNGLLYDSLGNHIPLPVQPNGDSPGLTSGCYFNISCVDGYTVPVIVEVQRPPNSQGNAATECHLAAGARRDDPDLPSTDWQILADTSEIPFSQCPTTQRMWFAPKTVVDHLDGKPNGTGDGWNTQANVAQYPMAYLTESSGNPNAKIKSTFAVGAPSNTNLRVYRDPQEVGVTFPAAPQPTIDDMIGCAAPCSILTQTRGASMTYPKDGGHFPMTSTYLVDPLNKPLLSIDPGVGDVCCQTAPARPGYVVNDTNLQCNTSKWWTSDYAGTPLVFPDGTPNYNFGFYAGSFAPAPPADIPGDPVKNPWWYGGQEHNPYQTGPGSVVQYVALIRGNQPGQDTRTHAYAYAHDDSWNITICGSIDAVNLIPAADGNPAHYAPYKVRIRIMPDA